MPMSLSPTWCIQYIGRLKIYSKSVMIIMIDPQRDLKLTTHSQ